MSNKYQDELDRLMLELASLLNVDTTNLTNEQIDQELNQILRNYGIDVDAVIAEHEANASTKH